MSEEKYVELFYLVTFTDDDQFFIVPTVEIDEPEMAELCVPHKEGDVLYGITCYVTNYPNWQPLLIEPLLLKNFIDDNFSKLPNTGLQATGKPPAPET